jgi:hypothetical protein
VLLHVFPMLQQELLSLSGCMQRLGLAAAPTVLLHMCPLQPQELMAAIKGVRKDDLRPLVLDEVSKNNVDGTVLCIPCSGCAVEVLCCYAVLCCDVLCWIVLGCVMPCSALLCFAVLCCAVLCRAMCCGGLLMGWVGTQASVQAFPPVRDAVGVQHFCSAGEFGRSGGIQAREVQHWRMVAIVLCNTDLPEEQI